MNISKEVKALPRKLDYKYNGVLTKMMLKYRWAHFIYKEYEKTKNKDYGIKLSGLQYCPEVVYNWSFNGFIFSFNLINLFRLKDRFLEEEGKVPKNIVKNISFLTEKFPDKTEEDLKNFGLTFYPFLEDPSFKKEDYTVDFLDCAFNSYIAVTSKIVQANTKLIHSFTNREIAKSKLMENDRDEIFQRVSEALLMCLEKYDPEKSALSYVLGKYYVSISMRGYTPPNRIKMSSKAQKVYGLILKREKELRKKGEWWSDLEKHEEVESFIVENFNSKDPKKDTEEVLKEIYLGLISLDQPIGNADTDGTRTLAEVVPYDKDIFSSLEEKDSLNPIIKIIEEKLTIPEKICFCLREGLYVDKTLAYAWTDEAVELSFIKKEFKDEVRSLLISPFEGEIFSEKRTYVKIASLTSGEKGNTRTGESIRQISKRATNKLRKSPDVQEAYMKL